MRTSWLFHIILCQYFSVEKLIRKALEESKDIHLTLLEYRNTPVAGLKYSPAQLLMSRMLKDKIPITSELLAPKVAEDAYRALKARQRKQKAYYDRGTKPLSKLNVGDSVRVRLGRRDWTPAVVTELHSAPRSYLVTTENGRVYRRNRRVINPSCIGSPRGNIRCPKRSRLAGVRPGRTNPTGRDTTAAISTWPWGANNSC